MTEVATTKTNRRGWHFTPEHQRAARARVKPESNRANGAKGWAACAARFGSGWAGQKAADWRRANPNRPTRIVMDWLNEFCVSFELEVRITDVYADIVCKDFGLLIEIDGEYWHSSEERQARDAFKDQVFARAGWLVLRLAEADIKSGEAKTQLDYALHNSMAIWRNGGAA